MPPPDAAPGGRRMTRADRKEATAGPSEPGGALAGTWGRYFAAVAGSTRNDARTELAAVLAMSAVRNNDRVGLVLFTDRVEHVVGERGQLGGAGAEDAGGRCEAA